MRKKIPMILKRQARQVEFFSIRKLCTPEVGTSFWIAGHIGHIYIYAGQYEQQKDLFNFTFDRKWAFAAVYFLKKAIKEIYLRFDLSKKIIHGPN